MYVRPCPVCATPVSADALFCPACGTTLRRRRGPDLALVTAGALAVLVGVLLAVLLTRDDTGTVATTTGTTSVATATTTTAAPTATPVPAATVTAPPTAPVTTITPPAPTTTVPTPPTATGPPAAGTTARPKQTPPAPVPGPR